MRALIVIAALSSAATLPAQSLAKRIAQSDGAVQVIYASRPSACGDGANYITNVLGTQRYFTNGSVTNSSIVTRRGSWNEPPCVRGPARVVATVIDGEVTRLRAYVGPVPASGMRTIETNVSDARAWLEDLITSKSERVAREAILPLILADSTNPWPLLLRVARDDQRPLATRRAMLVWLVYAVDDHLGIADATADTDDDEMAKQAVFVLSQRTKRDGTADLMDLARSGKRPAARHDAIFWLSQTGDVRAVADLYAELLKQ